MVTATNANAWVLPGSDHPGPLRRKERALLRQLGYTQADLRFLNALGELEALLNIQYP
jgi:hypothetical protein